MSDNSEVGLYKFYSKCEGNDAVPTDLQKMASLWLYASEETKKDIRIAAINMKRRWEPQITFKRGG